MIRRNHNILRSKKGFKEFIKYNLADARRFIISCDSSPLFFNDHLEEYCEALELDELGNKYVSLLSKDEMEALKYFRYHLSIDNEPSNYYKLLDSAYSKWLKILPKDKLKLSPSKTGKVMKIVRKKNNISIINLAMIMNVDRNTISKYENGERLPSLDYFYKFCYKFKLSMDKILK